MGAGGIILCGGMSTRMGVPKATLPFGKELMLPRVVRILAGVVDPVLVVAAPDQELPELPPEVRVVRDERRGRGPLEGLYAGLREMLAAADAAYVTSCDVPLLVPGFVTRMIELLDGHDIAVPFEGRFHHPLWAVYRTSLVGRIGELLKADRLRPVFLFECSDTRIVPVDALREVDPELATLRNLNQPADYLAALKAAGYALDPGLKKLWNVA